MDRSISSSDALDVLEAVRIGVVVTDDSGHVQFANEHARTMLGNDHGGDAWQRVVDAADRDVLRTRMRAVLDRGASSSWRHQLVPASGTTVWLDHAVSPLVAEGGRIVGVVSTLLDATAEHHMEQAFEGSRDFTSAVLDTVGAFVVVLDVHGRILRMNAAMESLGIDASKVVGSGLFDGTVVPPEHLEFVERALEAMLRDELGTVEVDMPLLTGRRRVVWNSATHRDANGRVRTLIATGVDITELRALEARLSRHDRLDSISRLAAGVAHDVGNTLSVIEMRLERLRVVPDPRVAVEVAAIERTITHATELIGDLVAFSKPAQPSAPTLRLDDELRRMRPTVADMLDRSVRMTMDLGAADVLVPLEPAALHRVMTNLCANANDAMPDGGRLTIRSSVVRMDIARRPSELSAQQLPDGLYAEVGVADTGVGIDRGLIAKIFEPYFTTKTPGRGTGLGLATVYGAIVQSGGAIHVDSALGQGAVFTFWLPIEAPAGPIGRSA